MKLDINIKEDNIKYDIYLKKGLLNNLETYIDPLEKMIVFVDNKIDKQKINNIFKLYLNIKIIYINTSESIKNIDIYTKMINDCLEFKLDRHQHIIGIGGGLLLDLVGFVSSTYLRGVNYISIPSTTLSQIDSCLGNKVGINHNGIKNMIGSFYSPKMVLVDVEMLETLDSNHYKYGIIEGLKVGLLKDSKIIDLIEEDIYLNIEEIIYRSLLIKKDVVTADLYEKNIRKILNFGHTIGHGIEASYMDELYHGQCVGMGMLYMIKDESLRNRVIKIYQKLNINYQIDFKIEDVLKYIEYDKKRIDNMIEIIVLNKLNEYEVKKISLKEIENIIKEESCV